MAVSKGRLDTRQRVRLANAISGRDMETIALGYLGFEDEELKSLIDEHKNQVQRINRDILQKWCNKNSGDTQTKILAAQLYEAAKDEGCVDPDKVEKILGISEQQAAAFVDKDHVSTDTLENEIVSMVQHLRDYTAKNMKPEMGPWVEEYTVKMEDIQTTLKWKKEGQRQKPVTTDYQAIYNTYLPRSKHHLQKEMILAEMNRKGATFGYAGKDILVEGAHGTGRSVLCKKIAWDWATGEFTTFSLVFLVSMKLVRPADSLENAIIDQYQFKNSDTCMQTITQVLEKVGDRCLVIMDGVDQHPEGFSSEFLATVMGEKYFHVNFLITSTPGLKMPSLKSFKTVATIVPPKYTALTNFDINLGISSKRQKIETKILIRPNTVGSHVHVTDDNPMLRTFLYVLVGNNVIDLHQGEVTLGELFTKLLLHAYKSYKFLDHVGKIIGKLAFDGLLNEMLPYEEIPVDDPLLEPNSNNLVVFRVRALQISVAALHFVQALDEGQTIGSLLGSESQKQLLMTNYLFLYFTLWLLQESKECVVFKNSKEVYHMLLSYVKNKIDFCQLFLEDVVSIFPALDFCLSNKLQDGLVMQFMKDVVGSCENTEVLALTPAHPVQEILPVMRPVFFRIRTVCLAIGGLALDTKLFESTRSLKHDVKVISGSQASEIDVIMNYSNSQNDATLLDFAHKSTRPFSLYFVNRKYNEKPMTDLTDLIKGNIRKIYIRQAGCFLFANKELNVCPYLTHLSFASTGLQLNRSVFTTLCEAAANERFPNISHLSFSGCNTGIKGKLEILFNKAWPTLTHLDVTKCDLDEQDVEVIFAATHDSKDSYLPKLISLALSPQKIDINRQLEVFMRPWTTLKSLRIFDVKDRFRYVENPVSEAFCDAIEKGVFPNLTEIGLSEGCPNLLKGLPQLCSVIINGDLEVHRSNRLDVEKLTAALSVEKLCHIDLSNYSIASDLPHLVCHSFPSLESLILSNCDLSYIDARSLAQANGGGKFPKLKHLDISKNGCCMSDLFEFGSSWVKVVTLTTGGHYTEWNTDFETLVTKSQSGCLNRLEKLEIWFQNLLSFYSSTFCQACHHHRFDLPPNEPIPTHKDVLAPIANNIDKLQASSLKTIYVYSTEHFFPKRDEGAAEKLKIRSKNICVYFIVVPQW